MPNKIKTAYGSFIPQTSDGADRKKHIVPVVNYPSGALKSLSLQEPATIKVNGQVFPVELMTFYEDGSIKKLFPLNGQLTGYWSEDDETALTASMSLDVGAFHFDAKVISIGFYPSSKIKSINFWPQELPKVELFGKQRAIRHGISFYEDGSIKSVEPAKPLAVETLIGKVNAFDMSPVGLHADKNSLEFSPDGSIKSLMTSTDIIEVILNGKVIERIEQKATPHWCDENKVIYLPVKIEFDHGEVVFNGAERFPLSSCEFNVIADARPLPQFHC